MSNSIFRKDGTAQGVAKQRLIETLAKPGRRVISDPYADRFVVGAGLLKLLGHNLSVWVTKKFAPGFHEHLISRTRFIDDLIKDSAAAGMGQYVILGAGYDTRAHRLELPSSIRIFEVDQPEVQAKKRSKLPKEPPNSQNVTYVSIDFNHQSLAEQLLAAGFDQSKSTIFTLEGVSQYISKEALSSTIKELATLSQKTGSTFFMSYVDKLLDEDPEACFGKGYPKAVKRAETIKYLASKVGEPWISLYTEEELEHLLSQNGLVIKENKSLADLNSVYFTSVGRTLPEDQIFNLEHFLVARS
ncbi:SAM-dependent methyltransferase [Halieaceae bacterium IMCC14734]|uniref:S-adenosyl-L-methionine-dependent methyltransferase n=1 Tax=Candidatus Litorirhabdus singularis TaxID=2518993 RepID=A0ABT3TLI6_9GAMM|nr:class I SAM-dependent methyltransferase [Candidatus Litorirhabdus singularis]MCX2983121.1 SAM-dependent methyltransferase [Candidatus Litorirhabdus singularis]